MESQQNASVSLEQERRKLHQALTLSASRATGYGRALAAVLRRVCETGGWVYAEAWLASRDGSILKPGPTWPRVKAAFRPIRERSRKLGFLRGNDLPGRVLKSRAPEWVEDVSSASKQVFGRPDLARQSGLRAALALPLLNGNEVLAVLVFYAAEPRPKSRAWMEFVAGALAHLGPLLERKKIEEELRVRARQQEAVALLGVEALEGGADAGDLIRKAVELVTAILEVEHGEVIEGAADSLAEHVLSSSEPTVIEDFERETRFEFPERLEERDIASGVCVIIHGHDNPFGVLGAYTTRRRRFTENDVSFMQGVANVLGTAIERHRAHQELERLVEERTAKLEASHEQLRQSERLASIGTLAAGLGHDMKNILLPVMCRLDALEKASQATQAEVGAVRRSLDYLRRLSRGLRLFALDPDDAEASDAATQLGDWWEEVGPLLEKALPPEVEFEADLPKDLPSVPVPEHRLTQAVLNLVVNAGEATEGKGRVRLWAKPGGDTVRLGVTDNGHGMSREVQGHALEPFFTTKKRRLSTGLGLSLVHGLAQSAGGSVKIQSKPGQGTTVTLTLPVVRHDVPAPGPDARIAAVSLGDQRASAFAASLLRSAGFEVRHVDEPGESTIWITDEPAGAQRYLDADRGRRVIVLGQPGGSDRPERMTYVDGPLDLEGLHQTLRSAVRELPENGDAL